MNAKTITGGCQCGRIRYEITGPLINPHICHCRMCQRAFGNFFASLVGTKRQHIHWPKGEPEFFQSSSIIKRGFCASCGTPLTYANDESDKLSVSIGSLDDPNITVPEAQYGTEGKLVAFDHLHELPGSRTEDDVPPEILAKFKSWQYEP